MFIRTDNLGRSEILTGADAETESDALDTKLKATLKELRSHPRTGSGYLKTARVLRQLAELHSDDEYTKKILLRDAENLERTAASKIKQGK